MRNNEFLNDGEDRAALLEAFAETARRLSFADAADALGVTRSTLSRRVQKLEAQVGAQLLNRTTRVVSLTEAGSAYYQYTTRILDMMAEADAAAASLGGQPSGRLILSVPSTYGRRVIAPLISGFMQKCPEVRLDFRLSDSYVDLVESRIDVAIRIGEMSDSSLIARRLGPVKRRIVASPSYLERHGRPKSPKDLGKHRCLHFTPLAKGERWVLSNGRASEIVPIAPWLRSDDAEILFHAACGGEGIALLADFITHEELKSGVLADVLCEWSPPETGVSIVYPNTGYLPEKTRVFVDYLVQTIGSNQMKGIASDSDR
jgi:DNA-binding transcriptional LysR family regulator